MMAATMALSTAINSYKIYMYQHLCRRMLKEAISSKLMDSKTGEPQKANTYSMKSTKS